jgi:hypothetical protein
MISGSLIISLLIGMQGIMAASERQQFSRCLRAFVDSKLAERMEAPAFQTAIATACAPQEAAYRAAYLTAATRAGDSRSRAQSDADIEVEDLRDNFKELFENARSQ